MTRRWTSRAVVLTASFLALTACASPGRETRDATEPRDPGYPGGGGIGEPMVVPATTAPTATPARTGTPARTARPVRTTRAPGAAGTAPTRTAGTTRAATPAATVRTGVVGRGSTGGGIGDDSGSVGG
ncbi:hypothetical protein [Actinoplanes teichomyceticus]|uniref:Uncharacterized protein n=1 Tax=Actinoplanes teichomyceticus TaxID=1867 RepID=A0A561WP23_ACTTI|nr:hypothetical protein [Actinoplanes teichomyceticus]TWG25595.1 hypothetical protein FHX34_101565 [Actinoplanes teichomyceticus]GIF10667.1 hypothetical protein Ate01nite_06990 [Actinoplanes teichomyceticus]